MRGEREVPNVEREGWENPDVERAGPRARPGSTRIGYKRREPGISLQLSPPSCDSIIFPLMTSGAIRCWLSLGSTPKT